MQYIYYDLETDGLLHEVTKIHCAVFLKDGEIYKFYGDSISDIYGFVEDNKDCCFVAHNGVGFDEIVLEQLLGVTFEHSLDTLCISNMRYPDLLTYDWVNKKIPKKLWGSHSLEAWGHRIEEHKAEYSGGWDTFSEEMLEYCVQDVLTLEQVFLRLYEEAPKRYAREHTFKRHCVRQNQLGCSYDTEKADSLLRELTGKRAECLQKIRERWPDREILTYTPVRRKEKTIIESFNPRSSKQLIEYLTPLGFRPLKRTDKGAPSTEEDELIQFQKELTKRGKHEDARDVEAINNYRMVSNRLTKLQDGKSAFNAFVREDNRITHRLNHIGTQTHRCSHTSPPLGQVTSIRKPYGKEFRELFRSADGYDLVGGDLASLELRILAHFLGKYDGGEYANIVLHGDPHSHNLSLIHKVVPDASRDDAKVFFYALVYGASATKIGAILNISQKKAANLQKQFMIDLTGYDLFLNDLRKGLKKRKMADWKLNKWGGQSFILKPGASLTGLDGRRVPVRSDHSLINFMIQSSGAIIMKETTNQFHRLCKEQGLVESYYDSKKHSVVHGDYSQLLHVHDEMQIECLPEHTEAIKKNFIDAAESTTAVFNLKCPISGDVKVGKTWRDTH